MDKLKLAKVLATSYHSGQKDRGGVDYVNHPIWVSNHCKSKTAKIVGLLHDIIEDTPCTYEILKNLGFGKKVIAALTAVTHIKSMPYDKYIDICRCNKIAREVKFWDMVHNIDLSRIPNPTQKDIDNRHKYIRFAIKLERTKYQYLVMDKIVSMSNDG